MSKYLKYKGVIYRTVDAEWDHLWKKADDLRDKALVTLDSAIHYYELAADSFLKEGDKEKAREASSGARYYKDVARKMLKRSF